MPVMIVEAISGAMVMARAGFRELCELASTEQLSVIVADIPDRLGRGDAIAKLEFMAQIYGARIEYAQPSRDTTTIEGLIKLYRKEDRLYAEIAASQLAGGEELAAPASCPLPSDAEEGR